MNDNPPPPSGDEPPTTPPPLSPDADLALLAPYLTPECDPRVQSKAVEYLREIRPMPVERIAVLLAIQHMLVESCTSLLQAHERRLMKEATSEKILYTPHGKRRIR